MLLTISSTNNTAYTLQSLFLGSYSKMTDKTTCWYEESNHLVIDFVTANTLNIY